jgi:hypothetical protein
MQSIANNNKPGKKGTHNPSAASEGRTKTATSSQRMIMVKNLIEE